MRTTERDDPRGETSELAAAATTAATRPPLPRGWLVGPLVLFA